MFRPINIFLLIFCFSVQLSGQDVQCKTYERLSAKVDDITLFEAKIAFLAPIVKDSVSVPCLSFVRLVRKYGSYNSRVGNFEEAMYAASLCIELCRRLPASLDVTLAQADALRFKARLFGSVNRYEKGLEMLIDADNLLRPYLGQQEEGVADVYADVLYARINVAEAVADYDFSLVLLDRITEIDQQQLSGFNKMLLPINRSQMLVRSGRIEEGLMLNEQYLAKTDFTGNKMFQAYGLAKLGDAALLAGDLEKSFAAQTSARKAFKAQCENGDGAIYPCASYCSTGGHLISYYIASERYVQADSVYHLVLDEMEERNIDDAYIASYVELQGARSMVAQGNRIEASARFQNSLEHLVADATPQGRARLPRLRSNEVFVSETLMDWLLAKFAFYAAAENPGERSLAFDCHFALDSLLYNLNQKGSLTAPLFATHPKFRKHYEQTLGLAYDLYTATKDERYQAFAFRILAGTKGNALRRRLDGENIAKLAGIPTDSLKLRDKLRTDIAIARADISAAEPADRITSQERLLALNNRLSKLDLVLAQRFPLFANALVRQRLPEIKEMPELVANDQVVLDFFLGEAYLFVTKADAFQGVKLYRKPLPVNIDDLLVHYLDDQAAAATLYAFLLADIVDELPARIRRITVIPDDKLWPVAFAALRKGNQYLIEAYSLSTAYGWQSYEKALRENPLADRPFVGFGVSFAGERGDTLAEIAQRGTAFSPLPFAVSEVLTGAEIMEGDAFVDSSATKRRLLEENRQRAIIHLATHATVDELDPYASAIYLTHSRSAQMQYGRITMVEIMGNEAFRRPLIVLNACQTADGTLASGEGVNSFARAFRFNGTRAVLAHRWALNDGVGAELSARLYEQLAEGSRLDDARRTAMVEYLERHRTTKYESPRYWASSVVLGYAGGVAFYKPGETGTSWSKLIMVICVISLIGLGVSKAKA